METGKSLSNDFNDFVSVITPFFGTDYFNSVNIITFCKICSVEIKKVLLYEHNNYKEHTEIQDFLIVIGMTHCEHCSKEKRIHEWREQIILEEHLGFENINCSEVCKKKDLVWDRYPGFLKQESKKAEHHHRRGGAPVTEHHMNKKILEF